MATAINIKSIGGGAFSLVVYCNFFAQGQKQWEHLAPLLVSFSHEAPLFIPIYHYARRTIAFLNDMSNKSWLFTNSKKSGKPSYLLPVA
ncbi:MULTISPECIES: hypothetical protein [Okeania]|nr:MULTISPECIES: hypothetical protein [Okeania]NEP04746.1 hypothetical protein [Okeania sp. SIO4D6]NEP39312.1 hypothetical protein [Okeania sp. SIO2H7]NET13072.1 hypothetical protein [Okeania sp. SIO1H6]NEP70792.1 hypothetical protein [Okeania sp. SIO2G5]NEP93560.1 hypothetical protein [Okeania sp. SIO2F5]